MRVWPLLIVGACTAGKGQAPEPTPTPAVVDTEVDTVVDTEVVDTDIADPCREQAAQLRLGTGSGVWEPVSADTQLVVRHGSTGANNWHIELSLEARHVPRTVLIEQSISMLDGTVVAPATRTAVALAPVEGPGEPWGCHGRWLGMDLVVDGDRYGEFGIWPWEELCGVEVVVRSRVFAVGTSLDDLEELASSDDRVSVQPDPCDCAWCGRATPACESAAYWEDVCPDVPWQLRCERDDDVCMGL